MPSIRAAEASASYSRLRLIAIWMSAAAMGARITMRIAPNGLLRSSERPPPKIMANWAMLATNVMPMATAAATDPMRMSRLRTWESSWASTPRISSQSRICSRPWVTQTAALSGLRPVANALGCGLGDT